MSRASASGPRSPPPPPPATTAEPVWDAAAHHTLERRLSQRLKQVLYGKSTAGYQNYVRAGRRRPDPTSGDVRGACRVPRHLRDGEHDPATPRAEAPTSKRAWDAAMKRWRRDLHRWDPDPTDCGTRPSPPRAPPAPAAPPAWHLVVARPGPNGGGGRPPLLVHNPYAT